MARSIATFLALSLAVVANGEYSRPAMEQLEIDERIPELINVKETLTKIERDITELLHHDHQENPHPHPDWNFPALNRLSSNKTQIKVDMNMNANVGKMVFVECDASNWDTNNIYNTEDLCVSRGRLYKAMWWTQGKDPTSSTDWKDMGMCSCANLQEWHVDRTYDGSYDTGTVKYNGNQYAARWWTQGDNPEAEGVWAFVGPCDL